MSPAPLRDCGSSVGRTWVAIVVSRNERGQNAGQDRCERLWGIVGAEPLMERAMKARAIPTGWEIIEGGRAKRLRVSHTREIADDFAVVQATDGHNRSPGQDVSRDLPGVRIEADSIVSTAIRERATQVDVAAALDWPPQRAHKLVSGHQRMTVEIMLVLGRRGVWGPVVEIVWAVLRSLPEPAQMEIWSRMQPMAG